MPETSIVIRSFNEAQYIGDVLEAVEKQEYQDFEIILVDSGSTDGTLEIADEYVDKVEFVAPQNFTFGYSCNVGCEAASGEFISFLSAHAIPTDDQWLSLMIDNLRDENVAMTYSNQVAAESSKFPEKRLFNELYPKKRRRQTPPDYYTNNASSVIKRDLWEEHQFDEYLTGHEDIEWAKHFMEQGYIVVYEPDACVYHIHHETWEQVFNRLEREAIADIEIGIKKPSDRWAEYVSIPIDIAEDIFAAIRQGELSSETLNEIIKFRYNQHMGTVSGLLSERDLEADRYEYYYDGANKSVVINPDGEITIEQSPLPELKPNEVLIRTDYVGVNPQNITTADPEQYPISPSGNYVGTVAKLGANASSVSVGDVVIGETTFHCGICSACGAGDHQNCKDPIRLGVDTVQGAYSRFLTIPSDYVHMLPDQIDPRKGTLAGIAGQTKQEIKRANRLIDEPLKYLVVGDSTMANLTVQIISTVFGHPVYQADENKIYNLSDLIEFEEYNIIIETEGDSKLVRECVRNSSSGSAILLLGSQYDDFTFTEEDILQKTILKPNITDDINPSSGINILSEIDTNEILNGTYDLDEFEIALNKAKNSGQFPIISIEE